MFSDDADPLVHLTSPAQHAEEILGQPFSNIAVALDWLSPSHIIGEFVKGATGYDVFGEAAAALAGNWEQVWQCAGAFRNLAGAMQAIGLNISSGNVQLDGTWDGNAADAAYMYFGGLSGATAAQRIPLTEIAEAYEKAAEGTYRLMEGVSGIMKDIMDSAIIGVAAASAGTAAIETGVGFVAGWGIAAYETARIAEKAEMARKIIATASAVTNNLMGYVQSSSADIDVLGAHPLPRGGYHHPGTGQP